LCSRAARRPHRQPREKIAPEAIGATIASIDEFGRIPGTTASAAGPIGTMLAAHPTRLHITTRGNAASIRTRATATG